MKSKALTLLAALKYIAIFIGVVAFVTITFMVCKIENPRLNSIISGVLSVGLIVFLIKRRGEAVADTLNIRRIPLKQALAIVGLFLFATCAVQLLQFVVPRSLLEAVPQEAFSQYAALDVFALVIVSPVVEELFFRGLVLPKLMSGMAVRSAVVISSVLFGLMHFGVLWAMMAFLIGILYAITFVRTKSLVAPILAHMTSNLLSVIFNFMVNP